MTRKHRTVSFRQHLTLILSVQAYSGKMVSQRHYDRLAGLLKETKGTVAVGGKTIDEGRFIEPTVLTNVQLDDQDWRQASLPVRFGGLGLRSVGSLALPCYLSSVNKSQVLVRAILKAPNLQKPMAHLQAEECFQPILCQQGKQLQSRRHGMSYPAKWSSPTSKAPQIRFTLPG